MSWSLCVATCAAALLAACGRREETPAAGVSLEQVDPTGQKITFWHQHTEEREAALISLIERFNRTNPDGIEVTGEYAGTHDEIYQKMLMRIRSGALPGMVVAYRYQAQAYYENKQTVDLLPYMNSPRWGLAASERDDYFGEFIAQDRIRGVQVAFLPSRSMEVLYYNVDWLRELGYAEPPRTWEAFAEACRRAAQQPFSRVQQEGPSRGLVVLLDASRLAAMVYSRGGELVNAEGTAYTLNTPAVRESIALLKALVDAGAAEVAQDQTDVQAAFGRGRVLFTLRSSSGMPLYRGDVRAGADFAWDVGPVPYTGERPVPNVYGASLAVCRTTPPQQVAAWLFIKWFTQPEPQEEWSRQSGYFPVRRSVAHTIAPFFRISYNLLEQGKPEPWLVGYGAVRLMMEDAVARALQGGDLDRLLAQLEAEANRTLRRI
ncbi:MAG: extracellular solute-binding protein [Candidatus Latescibacterota bacterium]